MGSASSHEIREIVDEALVAIRTDKAGPLIDEDGTWYDDGGGYYPYYDDDSDSGSDSDTASDSGASGCDGGWCCSERETECCYETMECCAGLETGAGCSSGYKGGKGKSKKERKKGKGFWNACYPARKKGDWGGDVVGVSRCPGEQDPKKWALKTESSCLGRPPAAHVCTSGGERPGRRGRRRHLEVDRRSIGGDACDNGGRRKTLIYDEVGALPRGVAYRRPESVRPRVERSRSRSRSRSRWDDGRRRRQERGEPVMRGALRYDERGFGGRRRRRDGSYERRSDPDDRVGEIDDQSEGSYGFGERAVVPRREIIDRRHVRVGRI